MKNIIFLFIACCSLVAVCSAQQYRPGLFFREDWKEIPFATPVTQEHVTGKDLVLTRYGEGRDSIRKSHHATPPDDPYYIWSGLCTGNWAVTLKHKSDLVDLSQYGKIVWRSKQSGLRTLRIILKLANGTWLVSNQGDDASTDWRIREFNISDITWYQLDIDKIYEARPVNRPDLTKVEEIGFTDLMRGGLSDACSRLDWIEVYGKPVKKQAK